MSEDERAEKAAELYQAFGDMVYRYDITVIEADRQATRAALVAEICEWLRDQDRGVGWLDYDTAHRIEEKWGKL